MVLICPVAEEFFKLALRLTIKSQCLQNNLENDLRTEYETRKQPIAKCLSSEFNAESLRFLQELIFPCLDISHSVGSITSKSWPVI